jgi:hypothetical protein
LATINKNDPMKQSLLIIAITFLLVFNGCDYSRKKQADPSLLHFEELFNEFLIEEDSSQLDYIITLLNDSISRYENPRFISLEDVDTIEQTYSILFEFSDLWIDFKLNYRNIFEFYLTKENKVICDPKRFDTCDSILVNLEEFIFNPNDDYQLPVKHICIDVFGDTVMIPNHFIFISAAMIPDSSGSMSSWIELKRLITSTMKHYNILHERYAYKKWNKSFKELNQIQQTHVREIIPIKIDVFLNREFLKKENMPKPPRVEEVLDIISETDSINLDESLL